MNNEKFSISVTQLPKETMFSRIKSRFCSLRYLEEK